MADINYTSIKQRKKRRAHSIGFHLYQLQKEEDEPMVFQVRTELRYPRGRGGAVGNDWKGT